MARAVEDMHARLDGFRNPGVLLQGLGDEIVVIHHRAVVAYSGHGGAHAPVQVNHPDRHLHRRLRFRRRHSLADTQVPLTCC